VRGAGGVIGESRRDSHRFWVLGNRMALVLHDDYLHNPLGCREGSEDHSHEPSSDLRAE